MRMYLLECLQHNVSARSEDRLTQILSATFNRSPFFQRHFLKALGVRGNFGRLAAETQVTNVDRTSRPDMVIYADGAPLVVIEVKVDARPLKDQQARHRKLQAASYIMLTRDPVPEDVLHGFRRVGLGEVFLALRALNLRPADPVDRFLIDELVTYGKECDMLPPDRILASEFLSACHFLTETRLRLEPGAALIGERARPGHAIDTIAEFLQRMQMTSLEHPEIGKVLRIPRTKKVELRYGGSNELTKKDPEHIRRKAETYDLIFELDLTDTRSGFESIFASACFTPYIKSTSLTTASRAFIERADPSKIFYRCEMEYGLLSRAKFRASEFEAYEDDHDLEFDFFMSEALKFWKRKIASKWRN